ncbi:MAG TPA: hypothetical protein VEF35_03480 [Candidatus Bathyarchaeia archaeon]|nr:hypothetical protein [Candidatus Bathyarchaeia archaeon]
MLALIVSNSLFVRALILTTIIVAVTDAVMYYVIWSGRRHLNALFVVGAIFITMVPLAINLWVHIYPNILFLSAIVISAIIVSLTDALMFYVIWSGRRKITPLFVVEAIVVTTIPLVIGLWANIS